MATYTFEIPGQFVSLNEYVDAERVNRFKAAKIKKDMTEKAQNAVPDDAPHFEAPHVYVYFTWVAPNMRKDKDNVSFAKKFILDGLQKAGVIKRDSWKLCTPFDIGFKVNPNNPRTIVTITDERPSSLVLEV